MAITIVKDYRRYQANWDAVHINEAVDELSESVEEAMNEGEAECVMEWGIIISQTTNWSCNYFNFVNPPTMALFAIVEGEGTVWQITKHVRI